MAAVVLAGLNVAHAADWTQWGRTPGRNMACSETNLPADPGTAPTNWIANLGMGTYGTPALAGGKIVVGTNDSCYRDDRMTVDGGGLVMCLNVADGKVLWQLPIPPLRVPNISHFDGMYLGICGPATIEDDRVYLVSNRGEVLCLDMAGQANGNDGPFKAEGQYMARKGQAPWQVRPGDGDIIWRYDMVAEVPCYPHDAANSAVLVHGDLLYVGTSNGVDHTHVNVPCPLTASLIALDKKTGRLVARDDERIGTRIFDGQWSSPALAKVGDKALVVYGGGDGVCYAFEALTALPPGREVATLKKAWATDCNPPEYRTRDGKPIPFKGRRDGPNYIISTPVVYEGRVYVAIGQDPYHGTGLGAVSCLDAATGKVVWVSKVVERTVSTVSIADGLLYVADLSGYLHCLDIETGQQVWIHDLRGPTWSSTLVADGKVYIGTERRRLWVLAAAREKKVLADIPLDEEMYTTPIAANGVLYITTQKQMKAYRFGTEAGKGATSRPTSAPGEGQAPVERKPECGSRVAGPRGWLCDRRHRMEMWQ